MLFGCLFALALVNAGLGAGCNPGKVVKVVIVDGTPGQSQPSIGRLTIYRLGNRYARIEHDDSAEDPTPTLTILNMPDTWIVNRSDKSGWHLIDREGKGIVRIPVFSPKNLPENVPDELTTIEIGCEVQFFQQRGAPFTTVQTRKGQRTKQTLTFNDWSLVLVRRDRKGPPETLIVGRANEVVAAVRYLSYEEVASSTTDLFAKPQGVEFREP